MWGTRGQWSSTRGTFITQQTHFYNVYKSFWLPRVLHIEMQLLDARKEAKCAALQGQPGDLHTHNCPWEVKSGPRQRAAGEKVWGVMWKQPTIWALETSMCLGLVREKEPEELTGMPRHKHTMSWKPREAEHFSRWDLKIKRRLSCIWPFYIYPSSVQKAVGIDSLRSPVALRDFSVRVVTNAKVVHEDFAHSKKKKKRQ